MFYSLDRALKAGMKAMTTATTTTLLGMLGGLSPAMAASSDAVTIYSSAQPGAIPAALYRPVAGRGQPYGQVPGFAMVRHQRDYELERGVSELRVTDVAALIDPTTVMFQSLTDPDTRVLEQSFEFDLVNRDKLLQRYIGQPIVVEQSRGDRIDEIEGQLLSADGGLILRQDNGRVITLNHWTNLRFPELPGGLMTQPTLVWRLNADRGGEHETRISYQTEGMTWWADYNATFSEQGGQDCTLDLSAWVSIINQSGTGFDQARLKLIAGDVNRAQPRPQAVRREMMEMSVAMDEARGFEEKALFEYHLYTLGRPADLPNNATKQIELFPAAQGIDCQKELVYAPTRNFGFHGYQQLDQNYGRNQNADVAVFLRFANEEDNGLGLPLPAGRMRVSQRDGDDGMLEFIGEDIIDHTPKDEEILIRMGNAFDVVGERRQTDFRIDTRARRLWESFEVKLRNHKDDAAEVIVLDKLYRAANWEVENASHQFEKASADEIRFPIEVPSGDEVVLTYTVHYHW